MEPAMAAFNLDSEAFSFGAADAVGPGPDPSSLLFDRAPVPMWVFDQETLRFLAVNDAAVGKYGYSREEFLGLTLADIRPPQEVPKLRREGSIGTQEARPVKAGEWKSRSKAGEIFDVEITTTAVRFQGRNAQMAMAYDVSNHTREQHGISVRYALTRLLVESSGDITDKAMRVFGERFDFDLVELWQPYAANKMLLRKMFWQPPDDKAINPVAAPILLEPGEGTLAQTWISGRPAWIADFGNEPGYQDRVADLQRAGISEGIAFAVRARQATTGVIVLLSRGRRHRDTHIIELMSDIGAQIGQHMERCRVEKESRKSAENFRALFEEAPLPYHEIDRNGLVVRVNRAECDLLGLSPTDMVGKPVWDFVAPEEREESRESVRRKFAEGRVRPPYERKYRAPNGEERIFQTHERLITQPDGEVTGIRTAMLDMTAVHESRRKIEFQAGLLAQVGDAIVTFDRDRGVTYCNGAAERLFGISAEEALGKDYRSLVGVELASLEQQAILATVASQGLWKGEITVANRNGERMVLDVSDSALHDQNGHLQGIIAILRDVTQRKQAEEALRATEDRLTLAQSAMSIGSFEVDLKTGVAKWSEQLLRLFGISDFREGLTHEEWARLIHPEDRDRVVAEVAASVERQDELDRQYRVVWPDGTVHWLYSKTRVLLGPGDQPAKLIGVEFDITEHKAAEEKLRILSDAVEQSPVSIVITDLEGNIEYVNPKTTDITGYTFEELRGKNPRILKSGHTSDDEYRKLWATVPTGEWRGTFHNKKKNGELFWEAASIRPIRDSSGKPKHYLAVKEDITERKLAEDKIAWLASFPEQNPNPVVEIEVPTGVVSYVNPAARDLFPDLQRQGLAHAWLAGSDQLVEALTRADGNESSGDTGRGASSFASWCEYVSVGDRCWARTVHYLPETRRLRVYATDITERKRAEEALRQSESQLRLAQKLESIGQLAAGIAHEINTSIQYIGDNAKFLDEAFRDLLRFVEPHAEMAGALRNSGHADFVTALEQAVQNVDVNYLRDEIPKATEQLLEGVAHVARIVRAMKEFSHPSSVEKVPVDINRAIESTILISKNEWKYVADLTTDFDPELPPVPCVGGEFNQVILNLIVNAAHAIGDVVRDSNRKGSIRITTRREGGWVEVRVSDTGAGIPEDIRPMIFTPFFTTKEVGKGTGQGLAIAHSVIVRKHRGTIRFESEVGAGTTFVIRLPLECGEEGL
jgi:PAS domain S-box-containing protein